MISKTTILHWIQAIFSIGIVLAFFNFKVWDPLNAWVWDNTTSINAFSLLLLSMVFSMSWIMLGTKRSELQLSLYSLYTFLQFYFVVDVTLGPWFKWALIHLAGLPIREVPISIYGPNIINLICMSLVGISGLVYIFNTQKMKRRLKWVGFMLIGAIGLSIVFPSIEKIAPTLHPHQEISTLNGVIYLFYGLMLTVCSKYMVSPTSKYIHEESIQPV